MKNKSILFTLILIFPLFSYSQNEECRGLNFHSVYSLNQRFSLSEHFSTADSASVFLGIAEPNGTIIKIKRNGLTAWSKTYASPDLSISLFDGRELKDKNVLFVY